MDLKRPIFILHIFCGFLSSQTFDGMTLFSPIQGNTSVFTTFLIDNDLNVIQSWTHPRGAASMPYLMRDGLLYYPYRVQNPSMNSGGVGGGFSIYGWDGELQWSYELANSDYQHHHDIDPLENGNILLIAWELKTADEAYAVGRQSIDNVLNVMWSEAIIEYDPVGTNDANVVWEWHLWDHLIQDVNPDLPNYGVISEHPELQDINYGNAGSNNGPGGPNGDWKHFNAVDYNADLDQIVLSSRAHDEIYIIDHSTTTEEAAGHTGGNSGMGGDFLFRWGNPQAYDRGNNANHLLQDQHGVNWIPSGYPGEGNLILFNNNNGANSSAIFEIIPPMNENGQYNIGLDEPFGPEFPIWLYSDDFHTQVQGGAFRLPNGNTFVTDSDDATMFEVTQLYEVVWLYDYGDGSIMIPRAQKYPMDYLDDGFPEYTAGDVNFDGILNLLDLLYISDMVSGTGYYETPPADYNGDGLVDLEDISLLILFIMN